MRPGVPTEVGEATKLSLRCLAHRHEALTAEIDEFDAAIHELCVAENPAPLGARGVGPEVAAALLSRRATTPNGAERGIIRSVVWIEPSRSVTGKIDQAPH